MKNVKVLTALGMMSLASTATLAASAVPTLGSVLDASGIKVSGDVAASYTNGGPNGAFSFDQALLSIAYQPKDGFGAVVTLAAGDANQELTGAPAKTQVWVKTSATTGKWEDALTGGGTKDPYLSQAYVQYATGGLTVIGGRFATLAGYEVFPKSGNAFVTHSLSYGIEPTNHTGVRASYSFNDMVSLSLGLNNGIYSQSVSDPNNSEVGDNAVEAGVTVTPVKGLSLAAAYYNDQQGHSKSDDQSLLNVVASYSITNAVSVALSYDNKSNGNTDALKQSAIAAYANYALSDKYRLGLRLEELNQKDKTVADQQAATLVFGYSPVKSFELRTELTDVKTKSTSTSKSETDYAGAVQGVFKF